MSTKTTVKNKEKKRDFTSRMEQSQRLIELARTIRDTYDTTEKLLVKAQQIGTETIAEAIQCGQALIEAKKIVGHGRFIAWVGKHCRAGKPPKPISMDTANRYMRLANNAHMRHLPNCTTLRQAYLLVGIIPEIEQEKAREAVTQPDTTPTPVLRQELDGAKASELIEKNERLEVEAKTPRADEAVANTETTKRMKGTAIVPALQMWDVWMDEGERRLTDMSPADKKAALKALSKRLKLWV